MAWQQREREEWFRQQVIQRSYGELILAALKSLPANFEVVEYGRLSINPTKYPLFLVKSKAAPAGRPTALITGGVHGYETSGALGAIAFMRDRAAAYAEDFTFVCFPCVSPWAFETINRWNNKAIDPNRSFHENSPAEECSFFLDALAAHGVRPEIHIDLHETTDTDNSIFRPARAERDGVELPFEPIPDGFYLVGARERPEPAFQKAIIEAVRMVTHIAEPDEHNCLIGEPLQQPGVINYAVKDLGLCAGATNARFVTTTEVYPDSPRSTPQICIDAQVAAIGAGLDYLRRIRK